jgi:hypothetical protein
MARELKSLTKSTIVWAGQRPYDKNIPETAVILKRVGNGFTEVLIESKVDNLWVLIESGGIAWEKVVVCLMSTANHHSDFKIRAYSLQDRAAEEGD